MDRVIQNNKGTITISESLIITLIKDFVSRYNNYVLKNVSIIHDEDENFSFIINYIGNMSPDFINVINDLQAKITQMILVNFNIVRPIVIISVNNE
ncbi:MAG: hypothetical protein LBT77_01020 [Mycoplasmataceae bacterium]|jgi:hypothetical protein|nr:hypothetical protein [Mycoplasmataceae bacterium]